MSTATTASGGTLALIAYLGVFPTAIAISTWGFALSRSDAGRLALTSFLVPVIATVLGWVFLDELPPSTAWGGAALGVVGALLTRRRSRGGSEQDEVVAVDDLALVRGTEVAGEVVGGAPEHRG